jgi:hypothetical protein
MSSPSVLSAERRIAALKEYVQGCDDTVLNAAGREDICAWLDFISSGWDSTILMQWYPAFVGVMGHYLSALQEKIDQQKLLRDKTAAMSRRNLETQQTKVTADQAKAAALLDPTHTQACESLIRIERLFNFLSYVKEGMDPSIITAFGHNQRQEKRQDAE